MQKENYLHMIWLQLFILEQVMKCFLQKLQELFCIKNRFYFDKIRLYLTVSNYWNYNSSNSDSSAERV